MNNALLQNDLEEQIEEYEERMEYMRRKDRYVPF